MMFNLVSNALLQPNTRIRIDSIAGYEDYPAVTLDDLEDS